VAHRLEQRVSKLEEQGGSDYYLDQLTDEELEEYVSCLDAELKWFAAARIWADPESTPEQRAKAAAIYEKKPMLPGKFRDVNAEGGRRIQDKIRDMSDEELAVYEARLDVRLAELD